MEPTPPSGPENAAPLTRRTNPALDRSWLRSRRTQTFGLGALCGALALSLVVVVSSIFAASGDRPPVLPEPASEARTTPRATPAPASPPSPTVESTVPPTDATPDEPPVAKPVLEPEPAPVESEPPVLAEEASTSPGNSGSAPGRAKDPKKP